MPTTDHRPPSGQPLVTVIVLCYNQAPFVVDALESVRQQTYSDIELIITDDCSSDNSVAVVRRWQQETTFASRLIAHSINQGVCKTINEAIRASSGRYVAIFAADDWWVADKLQRQVELLEQSPLDIGVVYSDAWRVDVAGQRLPGMFIEEHRTFDTIPEGDLLPILARGNFIPALTPLIRRSCYDAVGLYDERLAYEDWDMWLRISTVFKFAFLTSPTGCYRIVPTSLTHRLLKDARSFRPPVDNFTIYESCLKTPRGSQELGPFLKAKMAGLAESLYAAGYPKATGILWRALRARPSPRLLLMCGLSGLNLPYDVFRKLDTLHTSITHRGTA